MSVPDTRPPRYIRSPSRSRRVAPRGTFEEHAPDGSERFLLDRAPPLNLGLSSLEIEGFLLTILVFLGVQVAWVGAMTPRVESDPA